MGAGGARLATGGMGAGLLARLVTGLLLTGLLVGPLAGCSGTSSGASGSPATVGTATSAATGTAPSVGTSAGGSPGAGSTPTGPPAATGRPDHVVVVVMENHAYGDVVGSGSAPWVNTLPAAVFTNWHAVTHPSQPNYLALFSGSTQAVTDDSCPQHFDAPNLGQQLIGAGYTFAAYSEGLPQAGDTVCQAGGYARKHAPWTDFGNLPAATGQPFTAFGPDYSRLPTVAFVIPDLCHDTHDCPVRVGDDWLAGHLAGYLAWARTHNSLLVITYDEDDNGAGNHILTVVAGAGVRPGRYGVAGDHYTLLRTLESLYGLAPLGAAAARSPVQSAWS